VRRRGGERLAFQLHSHTPLSSHPTYTHPQPCSTAPPPHNPTTPGAIDQLLDEIYSNDIPEPEWNGLDGVSDDDEAEDGSADEAEGGEEGGQQGSAAAAQAAAATASSSSSSSAAGDSADRLTAAPANPDASRHPMLDPPRRHRRGQRPSQQKGITSVFTWAGNRCCLGPLGALLPDLRHLNIGLPPSLAGLVMQADTIPVGDLQEAFISFGDYLEGDAGGLDMIRQAAGDSGGSEPPGAAALAAAAAAGPSAPALAPPPSRFLSLRRLDIGNLASPSSQFDPSTRLGDVAMAAIGRGLPALESLQLDGVLCFTGEGLSKLGALTRLKSLSLHHWMSECCAVVC
jgi:hypothetical protein